MSTKEKLQSETAKKLTQMAVAKGIRGAASMRKDELIKKLLGLAKRKAAGKPTSAKGPTAKGSAAKPKTSKPAPNTKPRSSAGGAVRLAAGTKPAGGSKSAANKPVAVKPIAIEVSKPKSPQKVARAAASLAKVEKPVASATRPTKAANPVPVPHFTPGDPQKKKAAAVSNNAKTESSVKSTAKKISQPKSVAIPATSEPKTRPTSPAVAGKIKSVQQQRASAKDLAFFREQLSTSDEPKKDRLVLFVRDPYWLQAYWEVTSAGVDRAKAALAEDWHVAVPVLRLLVNPEDGVTGSSEQVAREIRIHGGVNNWYIDVNEPPHTFRAVIGYVTPGNRFHSIAYSNVVHTPVPGTSDHVDHNWTDLIDNGDRVFSLSGGFDPGASTALREVFEEKLSRPMTRSALSRYGASEIPGKISGDDFVVDAELLIFGKTHRSSEVTISGEPVKLRDDGTFTVRVGLPDKRQVFPVSSTSFDGTFTYTTVLAIERNTKVMEPMSMEPGEDF